MRPTRLVSAGIHVAAVLLLSSPNPRAEEPFALKGGERVIFFGDSITQAGLYPSYVEAYLLTRFPEKTFTILNHGISSETISGTSEPDHRPRRPNAQDRFARDVAAWRPDVVVACFGMNDGNYHPFDEGRFHTYQAGVRRLIDRTRDEARARLVILTPPPFDPYRRTASDPDAVHFGYKFPAVDYDDTLGRFSAWLVSLRGEGPVVDVHSAVNEHLRRRRAEKVSFFLAGDAVHPGPTGHWLMAQALLLAWHAPAEVAEVRIDAEALRAEAGEVKDLERFEGGLRFSWRSPMPMPIDPDWDARSLALERTADRLNRYRLSVSGLSAPRYRVFAAEEGREERRVGDVDRGQLAAGVDLTAWPEFPTVRAGRDLLARLKEHRKAVYDRWRKELAGAARSGEAEDDAAMRRLRQLARPRDLRLRLVPLDAGR